MKNYESMIPIVSIIFIVKYFWNFQNDRISISWYKNNRCSTVINFRDSLTHTKIATTFYMKKLFSHFRYKPIRNDNSVNAYFESLFLGRSRDTIISMHAVVVAAIVPHDRIMRAYLIKIEIINAKLPHV